MIHDLIQAYDKARAELREALLEESSSYGFSYLRLASVTFSAVRAHGFAAGEPYLGNGWDDYQGDGEIFAPLPDGTRLRVCVSYGSCSGCDALESALLEPDEMKATELMLLSLHIVQAAKAVKEAVR